MYNPTEQIAEFSKTNVAQATKFAAISLENAEKFVKFNLGAAKTVFAQSVEGANAVAGVKDVQDLLALRTKIAEAQVQTARRLLASSVRTRDRSASRVLGARGRSLRHLLEGRGRVGRQGQQVGAGRFRRCRQRVQVDDRRDRPPRSTSSRRPASKS